MFLVIVILISCITGWMIFAKIEVACITYNRLIKIVIKNHCPFCGKSLMVLPINSEEYCPHCSCKIEQEHKKILCL